MAHSHLRTTLHYSLTGVMFSVLALGGCAGPSETPQSSTSPNAYGNTTPYGSNESAPAVALTIKTPKIMEGEIGQRGGTIRLAQIGDPRRSILCWPKRLRRPASSTRYSKA